MWEKWTPEQTGPQWAFCQREETAPQAPVGPPCSPLIRLLWARDSPNRLLSDESVGSLGHHWGSWVGEAIQSGWGLLDGEGRLLELSLPLSFAGERGTPSPYWPELMAISMMESLMCVAGSPCDSTSSGGPGSEMSSRAETSGGESRELVPSGGGRGVESPLWRGALDSSDRERTGEPW